MRNGLRRRTAGGRATPPTPVLAGIVERPPARAVGRREGRLRVMLVTADLLAGGVALLAASGADGLRPGAVLMPLLLVLTFKVVGLYDRDTTVMRHSTLGELPRLGQVSALFALLTWLFADQFVSGPLDRPAVLALWVVTFAGAASLRSIARAAARAITAPERVALVGEGTRLDRVAAKLDDAHVNAVVVARLETSAVDPGRFAGWLDEHRVHRLVLAPEGHDPAENLNRIRVAKARGVRVSLLPQVFEAVGSSVDFEDLDGLTMLGLRSFGLSRSSRAFKRGFDVVGATLGVVAVAPVLAALAVAVRLDSRGPVLFRQPRVGRDGVHFDIFKFRSMVDGADAGKDALRAHNATSGLFKVADDPRVTRVGRFLRASSLDELPQLFNVLRGEMSLVGPRPLILEEDALISGLDRSRLHLTPGMTGPWQVLAGARVPLDEMVTIDYLYVANWTLWRDVEILVRTVAHVVRRGGM